MSKTDRIRRIRPGQSVPDTPPRVYTTSDGYEVWRWKTGVRTYVEVLAHRVVDGQVTEAEHVHHKNHDKTDNRPTNLDHTTAAGHGRRHRTIDYQAAWQRYKAGYSTTEVAAEFGVHPATLSKRFREMGHTLRTVSEGLKITTRRNIDVNRVRELHLAGMRAGRIADQLNTTAGVVRGILQDEQLQPHPPGRPRM